jgi:acyl-CoA thioesterase-2
MTDRLDPVADLTALLGVEEIDTDLYRGGVSEEAPGRVFGGLVVAQALAAAGRSVPDDQDGPRRAHSLHAYFLRAGDTTRPIVYRVLRDFDGGSFANRRVVATQGGKPILNLAASFHRCEPGYAHAATVPDVLPPERCPTFAQALAATGQTVPAAILDRLAAFEVRPVPPGTASPDSPDAIARQQLWFRLRSPGATTPTLARELLAYVSDFALVTTAVLPHPVSFFSPRLQVASLDHALWFHADPAIDDWLLYAMDSPWSGGARGFSRGQFFAPDGTLVASVAQEGLIRPRD